MRSLGLGLGFNRHRILGGVVPLLDTYTGAAAAYSLRNLSSSTTNVVRVRRSSNDDEQDFTASEVSGGALATFVGAGNDGFVTTWYDQVPVEELSSAYGTSISGTVFGSTDTYADVAPISVGNFYRIQWTVSGIQTRGRVRFRNAADGSNITVLAGQGNLAYFTENGVYTTYVASDAGVSLHFLADSGQGFTYSNVSVVEIDRIPNDAAQTSASAQPKIVDAGSLITRGGNSRPYASFNGNNALKSEFASSIGHPFQSYVNVEHTTSGTSMFVHSGYAQDVFGVRYDANNSVYFYGGATPLMVSNWVNNNVDNNLLFNQFDGTNSIFRVNGVDVATSKNTGSGTSDGITIGDRHNEANGLVGYISELIVYPTNSVTNRAAIEDNINSYYSIYT